MYGCESWTIKKAECQRIDGFELWCWRRLLRVPWIARRYNQSILKEINPYYSLEGLMLKLKRQYFGHWLIGKDPDAGKDGRQEEKWRTEDKIFRWHHWLDGREFEQAPGVGDGQGNLACCSPWGHGIRHDWATELNWTETPHTHWFSGKESACQAGDAGLIYWSERSPGDRNGNSLQCSCLRNLMDRRAWRVTVHGVAKESNMT